MRQLLPSPRSTVPVKRLDSCSVANSLGSKSSSSSLHGRDGGLNNDASIACFCAMWYSCRCVGIQRKGLRVGDASAVGLLDGDTDFCGVMGSISRRKDFVGDNGGDISLSLSGETTDILRFSAPEDVSMDFFPTNTGCRGVFDSLLSLDDLVGDNTGDTSLSLALSSSASDSATGAFRLRDGVDITTSKVLNLTGKGLRVFLVGVTGSTAVFVLALERVVREEDAITVRSSSSRLTLFRGESRSSGSSESPPSFSLSDEVSFVADF